MADAAAAPRAHPGRAVVLTVLSILALVAIARAFVLTFEPALGAPRGALLWINVLPVALAFGVLFGLSGKLLFTAWSGYWLLWALHLGNAEKIEHLSRSLRPGDFAALPTFIGSPGLFLPYLDTGPGSVWLAVAGVALAMSLLLFEPRSLRLPWFVRIAFAMACGALLVSLFRNESWSERFSPAYGDSFYLWAPNEGVKNSGLVAGLMKLSWAAHVGQVRPDVGLVERFREDNAEGLRQRRMRPLPAVLPDVVIVQSESLFDPADLRGIEPDDVLPQFRRLAARGLSGRLQVPTFAGGTIRTEYELLTGYPLDAFPAVEYPYLGIALQTPTSLAHALAPLGYETTVLHPFQRAFWNREAALRALGFARMEFDDAFVGAPTHGRYISDAALFERILQLLPDEGPPQLMLAITMENHGPWNRDRGLPAAELAALPAPAGLSDNARLELRNYLAHVQAGDAALGPFADALLARKRPTLLLFFGDHLPDLGNSYEELGFDDDTKPWLQTVPYFIIGNVGYPQAFLDTESEFLATLLLDGLQVPFDGYLSFNASVRDHLAFGSPTPSVREHMREVLRHAAQLDYASGDLRAALPAGVDVAP